MPAGTRHLACSGHGPRRQPTRVRRLAHLVPRLQGDRTHANHVSSARPRGRCAHQRRRPRWPRRWPPRRRPTPSVLDPLSTAAAQVGFARRPARPHHLHPVGRRRNSAPLPLVADGLAAHGVDVSSSGTATNDGDATDVTTATATATRTVHGEPGRWPAQPHQRPRLLQRDHEQHQGCRSEVQPERLGRLDSAAAVRPRQARPTSRCHATAHGMITQAIVATRPGGASGTSRRVVDRGRRRQARHRPGSSPPPRRHLLHRCEPRPGRCPGAHRSQRSTRSDRHQLRRAGPRHQQDRRQRQEVRRPSGRRQLRHQHRSRDLEGQGRQEDSTRTIKKATFKVESAKVGSAKKPVKKKKSPPSSGFPSRGPSRSPARSSSPSGKTVDGLPGLPGLQLISQLRARRPGPASAGPGRRPRWVPMPP